MLEMKVCSACDESKSFSEFYKDSAKKDGLSSRCKECAKASSKNRYQANKDDIAKKSKQYRKTHQNQIKEQKHQWRQTNLEYAREKSREWGENNKERRSDNHRRWRGENQDHLREYWHDWQKENHEHYSEYQRKYRAENPQIVTNCSARRRAKIRQWSDITAEEWLGLMSQYEWECFYCGIRLGIQNRSVDHIIPISRGGRHHVENLIPCCRLCNSSKHDTIYPVWKGIVHLSEDKQIHLCSRLKKELLVFSIRIVETDSLEQIFKTLDDKINSEQINDNNEIR